MPGKVLLGAWLRCGSREHGFDRSYLRRSHLPGTLENMYGSCDLWIDSLFLKVGIEANSSNKSVVLESTLVFQAKRLAIPMLSGWIRDKTIWGARNLRCRWCPCQMARPKKPKARL